ncbi:hypothetical protein BSLA_02r0565 [Burkholderia stabilis]|nr:hypothetical protein BSLA_02r0565 [Burkholderia stabilis]
MSFFRETRGLAFPVLSTVRRATRLSEGGNRCRRVMPST